LMARLPGVPNGGRSVVCRVGICDPMRIVMCAYINGYRCGIQRTLQSISISVPAGPALGSGHTITPRSPTP
jgi:hypothetical protein